MSPTRREILAAGTAALGAGGLYRLVDAAAAPPRSPVAQTPPPPEQHLLQGTRVVTDEGVEVLVPPLHHQVVTARVQVEPRRAELLAVRRALEASLRALERELPPTPAGLGITLAWGLPYFRRFVPRLAARHLPVDLRASRARGRRTQALVDAVRFPSDPPETILERNDLAVLLRSDSLDHVAHAAQAIFAATRGALEPTSVRKGFAGGGFGGGTSLPKRMAVAAGVPGADLIPDSAELFLGFTSTQRAGLGPGRIANLETLGWTDARGGYFERGTHMHLSHVFEDLEAWYLNFDFRDRVDTSFRPGQPARPGAQTVPQGPREAVDARGVRDGFRRYGAIGHAGSIQSTSRLQADVRGSDGRRYAKGTAVPQRADFNTLDNPFFWSARPAADGQAPGAAAGVHFVVFNPSSDDFHRNRLAMDGVLPDGTRLPLTPRSRGQGFNSILRTTHRQNFLVPPRRARSFPLVELL